MNIHIRTIIKTETSPSCDCRSMMLGGSVLLEPLAAGLVNFNQQVFDILDLPFH